VIHETFDKPVTKASQIGPRDSRFAAAGDDYDDTIMQHARYINDKQARQEKHTSRIYIEIFEILKKGIVVVETANIFPCI
jgi:hypothetical protein